MTMLEEIRRPSYGTLGRMLPLLLCIVCATTACTSKTEEERAREAREEIDKSMPEVEATALAQTIDEDVVKEVQQNLAALKEYQGEINGVLDSVTLNALEAFQRSIDEPDNGIVTDEIRRKLADAARKAG